MRILIDARSIGPKLSGLGRHALNLLLGLSHIESDLEFLVLYSHPRAYKIIDRAGGPFRNRFHWISSATSPGSALSSVELPWIIKMQRADVFHDVTGAGDWTPGVKRVVTVHELDGLQSEPVNEEYRRKLYKQLNTADIVIAVSHSIAMELDHKVYISIPRIRIIPNAIDPWYKGRATADEIAAMRIRFKLEGDYFLCVSVGKRKSKNTQFVVDAADSWPGQEKWAFTLPKRQHPEGSKAFDLDLVEDIWLRPLYADAEAVVVPSTYEGFSLPPVEALASGTLPVVSSIATHKEFLGGVLPDSLFFNPSDPESLRASLDAVRVGGEPLRAAVLEKFKSVSDRFSFIETARRVHSAYREALRLR